MGALLCLLPFMTLGKILKVGDSVGMQNDMYCSMNISSYMDDVLDSNKGRKWFGTFWQVRQCILSPFWQLVLPHDWNGCMVRTHTFSIWRSCAVFLLCFSDITSIQQSKSQFVTEVFHSTVCGEKKYFSGQSSSAFWKYCHFCWLQLWGLIGCCGGVDRMPVILSGEDSINSWLNDELSEENIRKLTQPYEGTDLVRHQTRTICCLCRCSVWVMLYLNFCDYSFLPGPWWVVFQVWYPVTPDMGRPAFNGPECVEEVKFHQSLSVTVPFCELL